MTDEAEPAAPPDNPSHLGTKGPSTGPIEKPASAPSEPTGPPANPSHKLTREKHTSADVLQDASAQDD